MIKYLVASFDSEDNTGRLITVHGLSVDTKEYGPVARMYGDSVDLIQLARKHGLPAAPKVGGK
ncbi:hypothetical protein [Paramagnetospirillum magnetotacticum]|uniref:hypothetical protein n=1 Tax=Paramagnetospirillum magnetotacticum TaxID=188 RepID=UPI000597C25D|nr:hypothetical protein [Paramagnetospirillum magnetotacticum]